MTSTRQPKASARHAMTCTRLVVKPARHPQARARHANAILWLVIAFTSLARALAALVGGSTPSVIA